MSIATCMKNWEAVQIIPAVPERSESASCPDHSDQSFRMLTLPEY